MRRVACVSLLGALLSCCGGRVRHDGPDDSGIPPADARVADAGESDGEVPGDAGEQDAGSCRVAPDAEPPPAIEGRCDVVVREDVAHLPVGPDGEDGFIVVGGRRTSRIGRTLRLPGLPLSMLAVPGTPFVVVSDGGVADEQLSVIDVDRLELVGSQRFSRRESDPEFGAIFYGLAASSDGRRLYVSGGGTGDLLVFDLAADGTLQRDRTRGAHFGEAGGLRANEYLAGIAYLEASDTVVIASLLSSEVFVWDLAAGREARRIALPDALPYAVVADARGERVYVSGWGTSAVYVLDPAAGTLLDTIEVGKNPEGMALSPDGAHLAVAASDGDTIALIDTTTRTVVATIPIVGETAPRGASPVAPSWSADGRRLFVASSGDNAIDVLDVGRDGTTVTHAGRIPTMWYPTDVLALPDDRVVFLNGKHEGTGANTEPDRLDIADLIGGSITVLDEPPSDATLRAWDAEVASNNRRPMGFAQIECPAGDENDFPIPRPGEGPSRRIEHVVVVVRENKTYDAYLGDLRRPDGTPHGDGDPALTLLPPDQMDQVLPNTRRLALDFANLDRFFSSGEQSIQGHVWTTFGRTTDFTERTYPTSWGRAYWGVPPQGVLTPVGFPEEGSIFRWLGRHGVDFQNYNEIVAASEGAPDPRIPGAIASYLVGVSDTLKARYLGGRWGDQCRMPALSYVVLPNDHTFGGQAGRPTPRASIADNDEGVGVLIDEISHSTYWPTTAVFVIEDDPQQGGDHVDNHRSPALVISPWVRRGYVSSVHYSEPSVWRTVQLILGIDEPPNASVETAAPMLDVFTSTPDFTPWEHTPRRWPEETNPDGTRFAILSAEMNLEEIDQAEGLSRLLWQMLRGTEPPWPEVEDDD